VPGKSILIPPAKHSSSLSLSASFHFMVHHQLTQLRPDSIPGHTRDSRHSASLPIPFWIPFPINSFSRLPSATHLLTLTSIFRLDKIGRGTRGATLNSNNLACANYVVWILFKNRKVWLYPHLYLQSSTGQNLHFFTPHVQNPSRRCSVY